MKRIRIAAGHTADVWFGVNVSGKLYYAIRTVDGGNRALFWWIKWGLGGVQQLGELSGDGSLNIPIKALRGVVSAKLRANATVDTDVYVSDDGTVDQTVSFQY